MQDALNSGGAVLVHCHQGVSRSPALVMAYLLRQEGTTFPEVFRLVTAKRGIVDPKGGFCNQVSCTLPVIRPGRAPSTFECLRCAFKMPSQVLGPGDEPPVIPVWHALSPSALPAPAVR